jgi:hypothetical protein
MASMQNPPIGGLVILLAARAVYRGDLRAAPRWTWGIALAILAVHPLYYLFEIGRLTPLVASGDVRFPGLRALFTPLIDLNVGLLINAPVVGAVMAAGLWAGARSPERRHLFLGVLATYALFLCAFAQAPNVNSGGTPSLSRYALWLIPPLVPLFPGTGSRKRPGAALPALVGLSAIWTAVYFRPAIPESYLEPTRVALRVWSTYPSLENPLPEIFAERLRHRDGVNTLAATPNCAKVLVQDGVWPQPCAAPRVPPVECDSEGELCYANRKADGSYAFVPTSRRGGISISWTPRAVAGVDSSPFNPDVLRGALRYGWQDKADDGFAGVGLPGREFPAPGRDGRSPLVGISGGRDVQTWTHFHDRGRRVRRDRHRLERPASASARHALFVRAGLDVQGQRAHRLAYRGPGELEGRQRRVDGDVHVG